MHDFLVLIINILKRGIFLAIPVMLVCAVILAVVWIIFKKKKIPFPWKKALVLLLLTGWAVLTVYATLFRIEAGFGAWNLHLFAAWREALNKFTLQVWLNVLLNIALFVPARCTHTVIVQVLHALVSCACLRFRHFISHRNYPTRFRKRNV